MKATLLITMMLCIVTTCATDDLLPMFTTFLCGTSGPHQGATKGGWCLAGPIQTSLPADYQCPTFLAEAVINIIAGPMSDSDQTGSSNVHEDMMTAEGWKNDVDSILSEVGDEKVEEQNEEAEDQETENDEDGKVEEQNEEAEDQENENDEDEKVEEKNEEAEDQENGNDEDEYNLSEQQYYQTQGLSPLELSVLTELQDFMRLSYTIVADGLAQSDDPKTWHGIHPLFHTLYSVGVDFQKMKSSNGGVFNPKNWQEYWHHVNQALEQMPEAAANLGVSSEEHWNLKNMLQGIGLPLAGIHSGDVLAIFCSCLCVPAASPNRDN